MPGFPPLMIPTPAQSCCHTGPLFHFVKSYCCLVGVEGRKVCVVGRCRCTGKPDPAAGPMAAKAAPRPTFQTFQLSWHGCFLANFLHKYHIEGNILGCTVSFFFGGNCILSQRVGWLSQPDKEIPRQMESPLFFLMSSFFWCFSWFFSSGCWALKSRVFRSR